MSLLNKTANSVKWWKIQFMDLYTKNDAIITFDGQSIKYSELTPDAQNALSKHCKKSQFDLEAFFSTARVGEKLDLHMLQQLYPISSIIQTYMSDSDNSSTSTYGSEVQSDTFNSLTEMTESAEKLLTKDQQDCLIFGYVKKITKMPVYVLIKWCLSYYNDTFEWNVKRKQIQEIVKYGGVREESKPFTINNIPIRCSLASTRAKYCVYALKIDSNLCPKNISEIRIYYKLYCVESNIYYKNTSILTPSHRGAKYYLALWNVFTMKLSEYMDKDSLTFLCHVEILDIKYNENQQGIYGFSKPPIYISEKNKYQWNVNEKLLQDLNAEFLLSPEDVPYICQFGNSFANECFSLSYESNVGYGRGETGLHLFLGLYKLPSNIETIVIRTKIWIVHEGKEKQLDIENDKHELGYAYNQIGFPGAVCYDSRWDFNINQLSFKINFDIIEVYDLQNNKIRKEKWNEYGIIA
eukprot:483444_1